MARNKVGMESRRRFQTEKYDVNREQVLTGGPSGLAAEIPGPAPAPVDVAIAREQWERMLQGQPTHYRRIVQLRLQGRTNQEIADTLNLDERTVRRFLKKLRVQVALCASFAGC
jgi:DNA-directed RNA polymerase specialized sigma24 family protein